MSNRAQARPWAGQASLHRQHGTALHGTLRSYLTREFPRIGHDVGQRSFSDIVSGPTCMRCAGPVDLWVPPNQALEAPCDTW